MSHYPDDSRDDDADDDADDDDDTRDVDHDCDEAEVICRLCDAITVGEACDGCGVPLCPFHGKWSGRLWFAPHRRSPRAA